jgi:L-ascorbate metabolism protein UlaG (beta-lactamase superfamily)
MSIDQCSNQQDWIDHSTHQAVDTYPQQWLDLVEDWRSKDGEDALWLTYAANYLLRTAGVHWAIDPLSLTTRVGHTPHPDFQQDLSSLQLIVLSHIHSDHVDPNLLAVLRDLPITWVVPEFMCESVLAIVPVDISQLIIPMPGNPITFGHLVLTPIDTLHFNGQHGVPEMGYMAEFAGKRWLFPGDIRNFDIKALPDFGKLDGVLAHCWLGRGRALDPDDAILSEFCQFYRLLNASRVIVTHLHDFGRGPHDFWGLEHYRMIKKHYLQLEPGTELSYALMGDRIAL